MLELCHKNVLICSLLDVRCAIFCCLIKLSASHLTFPNIEHAQRLQFVIKPQPVQCVRYAQLNLIHLRHKRIFFLPLGAHFISEIWCSCCCVVVRAPALIITACTAAFKLVQTERENCIFRRLMR